MKRAITVLVAALGGEGGGVLAEWVVETATRSGYLAQGTSIPGVAQRTGATTYYVEIYPVPVASLGGRSPVLSLLPVPGCIDLLVSSELLETARTVERGMASPDRTTIVTSIGRTLTTAEKIVMGNGRFDSDRLLAVAQQHSKEFLAFDMDAIAAGTVVSAVMFGAIAASGVLPFSRGDCEAVIRASGVGVDASLLGFGRAWDAIRNGSAGMQVREGNAVRAAEHMLPIQLADKFPAAALDIIDAGYLRLLDYQDRDYAERYLSRLSDVLAAEREIDAAQANDFALTRETARFLALWMAFDDIVRVADLKSRASRMARVRSELKANNHDVVRVYDIFKPGMAEICELLPATLAKAMRNWDRGRQARGKPAFGVAMRVSTHGILGLALLRVLASLRGMRRRGERFAEEQALIENWLAAINNATKLDWQLAYEIALCGRLIKGYGATNERSKANLLHILVQLVAGGTFSTPALRAAAIRKAREAALADEGGKALDRVLVEQGALPRPVKAQPIRWTVRKKDGKSARSTKQVRADA